MSKTFAGAALAAFLTAGTAVAEDGPYPPKPRPECGANAVTTESNLRTEFGFVPYASALESDESFTRHLINTRTSEWIILRVTPNLVCAVAYGSGFEFILPPKPSVDG